MKINVKLLEAGMVAVLVVAIQVEAQIPFNPCTKQIENNKMYKNI